MPVVACSKCGTKNRVDPRRAVGQLAKCGKCGTPLDLSKAEDTASETKPLVYRCAFPTGRTRGGENLSCSTPGRPGADRVA